MKGEKLFKNAANGHTNSETFKNGWSNDKSIDKYLEVQLLFL